MDDRNEVSMGVATSSAGMWSNDLDSTTATLPILLVGDPAATGFTPARTIRQRMKQVTAVEVLAVGVIDLAGPGPREPT